MKYRLLFASVVAAALLAGCSKEELQLQPQPQAPATTTLLDAGTVYNGTIIVKMNEGEGPLTKSATSTLPEFGIYSIKPLVPYSEKYAARHKKAGLDRWHIVSFNPEVSVARVHNEFSRMEEVEKVDYLPVIQAAQATSPFNDPYLGYQWHYYNEGSDGGIKLNKAWEITTGREDVIVAVLDGGIDYNHDDLKDAMWVNKAEAEGKPEYDDDLNGYTDDVYGYNFGVIGGLLIGTISADDHGTHVAGTVAATNNNGKFGAGVAGGNGIAKGALVMSCQISDEKADTFSPILAFVYAADNGAVISQNSWGFKNATETPQSVLEGIDYFNRYAGMDASGENQAGPMAGGVTFFASGNSNVTIDYPSMEETVIAVSATGPTGLKASYSNYGEWVDISAPGGDGSAQEGYIFSTVTGNKFGGMQGTSMACPHVSGVAALIVSKFGGPGFTNEQLKERLLKSSNDEKLYSLNPSYKMGKKLGAGLLDAYAALSPNSIPGAVETFEATAKSNAVTVKWEATATEDFPTAGYRIYWHNKDLSEFDPASVDANSINSIYVQGNEVEEGTELSHTFAVSLFDEDIYMRIQAVNYFGEASALSAQVKVHIQKNIAPAFDPSGDLDISLKSFEKTEFEIHISDPDGHKIESFKFDGGSEAATYSKNGNKINVSINAAKAVPGTYKAVISATDEYGATGSLVINYTILPNTPPSVIRDFDNMVLGKGESITVDLTEYFKDEDGEKLKYEIVSTESVVTDYGIVDNTLTLSGRTFGKTDITVTASDAQKENASTTFAVLVRDKSVPADIYPTQVKKSLYVRAGVDGTYQLSVIGANGGTVYSNSSVASGPFKEYEIDASNWGTGIYTVVFKDSKSEYKTNIVKL